MLDDLAHINTKLVGLLVDHPVPVQGPNKAVEVGPLPLMLTQKERKKIRTQGRIAREKEKQEQIKLGLIEPPKPKVRSACCAGSDNTDCLALCGHNASDAPAIPKWCYGVCPMLFEEPLPRSHTIMRGPIHGSIADGRG